MNSFLERQLILVKDMIFHVINGCEGGEEVLAGLSCTVDRKISKN